MNLRLIGFIVFLVILNVLSCAYQSRSGHDGLALSDCYKDRKNQENISDQTGSIIMVADQYILLSDDENSRYLACNLPETYKKTGLKVNYSLITKEIYPNERLMGTPAYLKAISQSNINP